MSKILKLMIAKTDPVDSERWLPLWMHARDTAGVMEHLYDNWLSPSAKHVVCEQFGESYGRKLCVLLAYLHDIGKATYAFQSLISEKIPQIKEKLEAEGLLLVSARDLTDQKERVHSFCGETILGNQGFPVGISVIVASHHGKTPNDDFDSRKSKQEFYEKSVYCGKQKEIWENIWKEWIAICLEQSGFSGVEELQDAGMKAQILLTGLLIMADWLASNTYLFPTIDVETNGKMNLYPSRVERAMERIRLPDFWIPGENDFGMDAELFELRFGFSPNRVQQTVMEIAQQVLEPGIFIVEAQMGIGKTEAALAAAEILGKKAECGGIFFGLPTQATANGLFPRLVKWAEQQSEGVKLGIRLAHGATELNEDYQRMVQKSSSSMEDDGDSNLVVHSWFEGKKVALLADFVIGTVDQFLMAGLRQKHVMLRHLGLAGKVVIIDECHAYDAYMNCFLDTVLQWLGEYKVPVILLSATLPSERRAELVSAYVNRTIDTDDFWCNTTGYPLFTWTDAGAIYQKKMEWNETQTSVQILKLLDEERISVLKIELREGGCAGVILNTVKRAQEFTELVKEQLPEYDVILIHSQFLMPDRAEVEQEILRRTGKTSDPEQRNRLIVVGTQVLEQSLDIDFDVMITDLCPIDLLLQRIGREHRHKGRVRPQPLQNARCYVLTETNAIYEPWILERTRQELPDLVQLPVNIPELVQKVYAESEKDQKNDLWKEYRRDRDKMKSKASSYQVPKPASEDEDDLDENSIMRWLDNTDLDLSDAKAQAAVRLGNPSVEVLVLRKKEDGVFFLPWQFGGQCVSADMIPSGEETAQILKQRLRLPAYFVQKFRYENVIKELSKKTKENFPEWQFSSQLKEELVLLLDETLSTVLDGSFVHYDQKLGLIYGKEEKKDGTGV